MYRYFTFVVHMILWSCLASAQDFTTVFERSAGRQSATYDEVISFYRELDREYPVIDIQRAGPTDTRFPLHVVYYDKEGSFSMEEWRRKNKIILLINNGIHPGEPDGIDASMMLLRDAAAGKIDIPEQIILAVIPVFNIGGMLNRGSYSRANQNGPDAYGFRGNAQNLDLNRDFIKLDARETQTLVQLFHRLDPDIFIDNHVSNGADYQHVMTLLSVNPAKQGKKMGQYLTDVLEPQIYAGMKRKGYDLVPYVNHWGHTPDKGWQQFYEPPRFASGFAALFGSFAFVPETHMLKPFAERVRSTYALMETFIEFAGKNAAELKRYRQMERDFIAEQTEMPIHWSVDSSSYMPVLFNGYEGAYKPSIVSGTSRLYYDQQKPYTRNVPFYNKYQPSVTASVPEYYIIQQGWHRVIDRLRMNGVKMLMLTHDTTLSVTTYRITDFETVRRPYEGHYLHSKVITEQHREQIRLQKGDYLIPARQSARRYLLETLEPNAPDAFFAWGFFDAVLQQKEHYSDYVFEDLAADLLKKNPALKEQLEKKKRSDPDFAKDGQAQLDFIYRQSPYYEPVHMRYPVFRIDRTQATDQ